MEYLPPDPTWQRGLPANLKLLRAASVKQSEHILKKRMEMKADYISIFLATLDRSAFALPIYFECIHVK